MDSRLQRENLSDNHKIEGEQVLLPCRVVPRAGPDRPLPEAVKLEGCQIKKNVYIKLLFIRLLGLIWCPIEIKIGRRYVIK